MFYKLGVKKDYVKDFQCCVFFKFSRGTLGVLGRAVVL